MGDGAVVFMTDSIEAGNSRAQTVYLGAGNAGIDGGQMRPIDQVCAGGDSKIG